MDKLANEIVQFAGENVHECAANVESIIIAAMSIKRCIGTKSIDSIVAHCDFVHLVVE